MKEIITFAENLEQMKLLKHSFLGLLLGLSASINAQITTQTETIGDTELTITMDKRIENSIEALENSCKNKANKPNTINSTPQNTSGKKLSQAEICKQNPRILGYKIQVAVVKSKEEADKVRTDFRSKFPSIKVEIDASLRPNYKILAGSYYTKESASSDLRSVRKSFGGASAVQYRVFCTEAK